jgi:glycosyltransferase involved in cell wall biosynthesis
MKSSPLVSILIPAYNAEKYIGLAIKSALSQTWVEKEIIVVDDGSRDQTLSIAYMFEANGVKVCSQPNQGASAARNKALRMAKGDYIQFLDADDLLSENKIEAQITLLQQYPGRVAVCNTVHFFDGEDYLRLSPSPHETAFLYDTNDPVAFLVNLYGGNGNGSMVQPNAWLTPRSVIEEAGYWSEHCAADDDGEYFCRVLLASKGVCLDRKGLNFYRRHRHGQNYSAARSETADQERLRALELKTEYLLSKTQDIKAKKALARMYMELAVATYPQHASLSKKAIEKVNYLGGTTYLPVVGGKVLEIIKKRFGWRTARTVSFIRNRANL